MISKGFKITLGVLLVGAGVSVAAVLHLDNERLRKNLVAAKQAKQEAARLQDENQRARAQMERVRAAGTDRTQELSRDAERLRREVADLEKTALARASATDVQAQNDARMKAESSNPETGLTPLERFRDAGQTHPAAAFQTFVWAAMQGGDEKLATMIAFAGAGRAAAEAVVASLPEAARAKYSTPEKLAALFFADVLTTMQAAHIVEVVTIDDQSAFVVVRGMNSREQKIPMQLGSAGWQITMPEGMARGLEGWLRRKTEVPANK